MSVGNENLSELVHNYEPINDVHVATGKRMVAAKGAWMYDENGDRYLDMLAGYSALNFGHKNPHIVEAIKTQLDTGLTLGPRSVRTTEGDLFAQELGALTGFEMVLPMNGGAEAVESAIKTARKWGQEVKGVPNEDANIIVMENNFHGRTTTIISFSDDESARNGFGPFTPGFRRVPFDNIEAVEDAIDENTVAVLFEPIQGEAGIRVPQPGYLRAMREVCTREGVLMIADEIQSGFGRTGKNFACDHEDVKPDIMIVGKALGGGMIPSSAIVANRDVLGVFHPGEHGSTYGGNPVAAAVGRAAIALLQSGHYENNVRQRGNQLMAGMEQLIGHGVTEVRGKGLWVGVDIDPDLMTGHDVAVKLFARNVIAKEAHEQTLRLSPPFGIMPHEIEYAVNQVRDILYITGNK